MLKKRESFTLNTTRVKRILFTLRNGTKKWAITPLNKPSAMWRRATGNLMSTAWLNSRPPSLNTTPREKQQQRSRIAGAISLMANRATPTSSTLRSSSSSLLKSTTSTGKLSRSTKGSQMWRDGENSTMPARPQSVKLFLLFQNVQLLQKPNAKSPD